MSRFCVAAHFATLELYPQSNSVGLSPSFGPLEVQADCPFYPREQQHHLFSPRHMRSSFSHIPWKFSSMSQLYLGLVLHFSGDQMLDSSFFFFSSVSQKETICVSVLVLGLPSYQLHLWQVSGLNPGLCACQACTLALCTLSSQARMDFLKCFLSFLCLQSSHFVTSAPEINSEL